MLGISRQKVGAGSSSAMILGRRIRPATSAMRGFASSAKEVLLGDVGVGKSSLVLRFVKEQFVEFQQSAGIPASDIDSGSMPKQGRLAAIHKNCFASAPSAVARAVQIQATTPIRLPQHQQPLR